MDRYVARFADRKADWAAFEDAKIEGYKRAQHRFIGAGGSGKHGGSEFIPARGFTLSIMYVEPGQGNAAHTHEVEEVFRSEEHTSELQSLMRISYAVFCLKKKKKKDKRRHIRHTSTRQYTTIAI